LEDGVEPRIEELVGIAWGVHGGLVMGAGSGNRKKRLRGQNWRWRILLSGEHLYKNRLYIDWTQLNVMHIIAHGWIESPSVNARVGLWRLVEGAYDCVDTMTK
jgi:hypothetical protein